MIFTRRNYMFLLETVLYDANHSEHIDIRLVNILYHHAFPCQNQLS